MLREIKLEPDELVRRLLALAHGRRLSLLDSCGTKGARLLIAGFDPFDIIEAQGADALNLLDERLQRHASQTSTNPMPAGACIATFSYDLVHRLERLRATSQKTCTATEPDAVFAFYDTLVVHDYAEGKTFIASGGARHRMDETEEALRHARPLEEHEIVAASVASSNMTRDEYMAAVLRIKEHIAAGDIYQANLTQQFSCRLAQGLGPEEIFLSLRRHHPGPFAAFIRRAEDTVVSISPERFLRVDVRDVEREVEAWPIKGTRPRGATPAEDARLREELRVSPKDRAENVMIVDLMRNDLGRVCRYGTVTVASLCAIEEHPTLFHLVSKVRGKLRDDVTAGELLRACFPCGSITGAPKIRAMEIIEEIETARRGLSMGAIGYFAFDGRLDLSVAIRTMTIREGMARFNVGGGIVADSHPALEYEESLVKARALLRALNARLDQ